MTPEPNRQAVGEVLVVGQVALVLQQVVGAPVERLALPGRQVTLGGTAADAGSHPARATLQHAPEALQHPLFQFFAALDRHRVARLPQVSEHMKEVEHDSALAVWRDPRFRALIPLQLGTVLMILVAGKWFDWWGGLTWG